MTSSELDEELVHINESTYQKFKDMVNQSLDDAYEIMDCGYSGWAVMAKEFIEKGSLKKDRKALMKDCMFNFMVNFMDALKEKAGYEEED